MNARAEKLYRVLEIPFLLMAVVLVLMGGAEALAAGRFGVPLLMAAAFGINVPWSRLAFRREAERSVASLAGALGCAVAPRQTNRLVRS